MTPAIKNDVSVFSLDKRFEKRKAEVKKIILRALEILRIKKVSVDVYLAGDAVMKKLNSELRNKNYPADVLSFEEPSNFIAPDSEYKKIGEIFLNVSEKSGMEKLLVHGLLHLFGYDHKKEKEAERMEKMEQIIFNKISNFQ